MLLCTHTSAMTIYPYVYANLPYDPIADVRPVALLASVTGVLAISSAVPESVTTLAGYAKWLKANESARLYASPAAGSMAQFLGFRFAQAAAVQMTHVAYRGSAPAMQDLLGGQIPAYLGFIGDFLPYLGSGKIRLLAVTSEKRSRFLKDVPTFAEQGFASVVGLESYGVFAPAGTPDATVASLSATVKEAARDKVLLAGFDQIGLDAAYLDAPGYARLMAEERERWKPVVAASGFKAEA
jgi:tripartite-type tricarboxylate transporter receptor subunit TctC